MHDKNHELRIGLVVTYTILSLFAGIIMIFHEVPTARVLAAFGVLVGILTVKVLTDDADVG